jgi:hypothetical protein
LVRSQQCDVAVCIDCVNGCEIVQEPTLQLFAAPKSRSEGAFGLVPLTAVHSEC